jgi:hypothetical protein
MTKVPLAVLEDIADRSGGDGKEYKRLYMRERRKDPEFRRKTLDCQMRYSHTIGGRWFDARSKAKRRSLVWELTLEYYRDAVENRPCHYCGKVIVCRSCGLDRKDNSKGYVVGNVVPCCWDCNTMKSKFLSYDEMKLIWAMRRANYPEIPDN